MFCCSSDAVEPDESGKGPLRVAPAASGASASAAAAAEPSHSSAYRPDPPGDDSDEETDMAPPPKKIMGGGPDEAEGGKGMGAVKAYVGAIVAPSSAASPSAASKSAPDVGLSLEYAYGYRAFDSKSNLVSNTRGELLYPVAAVVVALNPSTNGQRHFLGHNDDIRCLAQNPADKDWIASGQNATVDARGRSAAPFVCVFNSTNFDESFRLQLFDGSRAVRCVAFSPCGRYVVAVADDNDHTLSLFDWRAGKLLAQAKGDKNAILQIKWNHVRPSATSYELVSVGVKHAFVWAWEEGSSTLKSKRLLLNKLVEIQTWNTLTFTATGSAIIGGFDGRILVVKAGSGSASRAEKVTPSAGTKEAAKVFSLDSYEGGIVAGLSNKSLVVMDAKLAHVKTLQFDFKVTSVHVRGRDLIVGTQGAQVYELKGALDAAFPAGAVKVDPLTSGHRDGELWALALSKDGSKAFTAGEDNQLLAWGLEAHKVVGRGILHDKKALAPKVKKASTTSAFPQNQCCRALALSPSGAHLAAGTNDGHFAVFSASDLSVVVHRADLNPHGQRKVVDQEGNWIQSIEYSPNGQFVAVGTHGSVIVILDVEAGYKVSSVINSHHSFITHMDWSEDSSTLRSNDGAYELLFHSIEPGQQARQITNASSLRDVPWASQHCPFAWGSVGVVPESGGAFVNSIDTNPERTLLVSGDDNGKVCLRRFPCVERGNVAHAYRGHSSHVTSVRFTSDGKRVLSTGGHDLGLMSWTVGPYDAAGVGKTHTVE